MTRWPFVLILACVNCWAGASDRYYPDIKVTSPDRQLRLDAKSPDNNGGKHAPFAAGFEYTLTDLSSGKVRWTHKQRMKPSGFGDSLAPDGEGSPMRAFVDNAGHTVLYVAGEELIVLAPQDGRKLAQVPLLDKLCDAETGNYVGHTTAGPDWNRWSLWRFSEAASLDKQTRRVFCVNSYWQHHVVVDVDTGDLLASGAVTNAADESTRAYLKQAVDTQRIWAMEMLSLVANGKARTLDGTEQGGVTAAVQIAGACKIAEAVPLLQALESGGTDGGPSTAGWSSNNLRQDIHLALRRLNVQPRTGPCMTLYEMQPGNDFAFPDPEDAIPSRAQPAERVKTVDQVTAGITTRRLVQLIGGPDYEHFDSTLRNRSVDYDIDTDPPFTLRVGLKDGKVQDVKRISAPVWQDGYARERGHDSHPNILGR